MCGYSNIAYDIDSSTLAKTITNPLLEKKNNFENNDLMLKEIENESPNDKEDNPINLLSHQQLIFDEKDVDNDKINKSNLNYFFNQIDNEKQETPTKKSQEKNQIYFKKWPFSKFIFIFFDFLILLFFIFFFFFSIFFF